MAALARAGWTVSAAGFLILCSTLLHTDHTGLIPAALLLFVIVVSAWRPVSGLEIVATAIPLCGYLMTSYWSTTVSWPEIIACGAIAGLSIDAARRPRAGRVPVAVAVPALLFGIAVGSAIVASFAVKSLTLGPSFSAALWQQVTREYFVDIAGFPGLHAGMLLIEGVLLFSLAARRASAKPSTGMRIVRAAAAGATLAGTMNIARLLQAAIRTGAVLSALVRMSHTLRWNLEYGDYNAAGSYFVMALFLATASAIAATRQRYGWALSAVVIAIALWLTGSRGAYVAGVLALGGAVAIRWTARERRRVFVAAGIGIALVAGVALVAVAPQRGNQGTSGTAMDIRFEMAKAGARMIEARPLFGVGLAEFYQRSGEFVSQKLLAEFPVSLHENAHDNFIQVGAELGLLGLIPFVWLVSAGLFIGARAARRTVARDAAPLIVVAGLAAFVITWLAGHPLLIPEASYIFWIVFGSAVGSLTSADAAQTSTRVRLIAAAAVVLFAAMTPLRATADADDAELEHVGIGVSLWMFSPDGVRCRSAVGHATLYVPTSSAFELSVYPRTDHPVRLEIRLEGRLADIRSLAPERWNDLQMPARNRAGRSHYSPLELRVEQGDQVELLLTKVRPLTGQ
jgi:O-antigen ligase